jgi:hypothetical protein
VVLLIVSIHVAAIQALTKKRSLPNSNPAYKNLPLEVSVLSASAPVPVRFSMPKFRIPVTPAVLPVLTLPLGPAEAASQSFAITVPGVETTRKDNGPPDSIVSMSAQLRRLCTANRSHVSGNLVGSRTLELLVRVEPNGNVSAVKVARSSGLTSFDTAVADCVLAHRSIEVDTDNNGATTATWQRMVWSDLNN